MPEKDPDITIGKILKDAFASCGIDSEDEPILIQWVTRESGLRKRRIDTIASFVNSLEDGDYHIELDDASITAPGFEQFKIVSMNIEATLKDGAWADVKVFSNEEELPTKEYANPQKIQDRMDAVVGVVQKVLQFLLLIWEAVKASKGFFSG
jgi:hypothetical protein